MLPSTVHRYISVSIPIDFNNIMLRSFVDFIAVGLYTLTGFFLPAEVPGWGSLWFLYILFSGGVSRLGFTLIGCFPSRGSRLCQSFVWHLDSSIFICWDDTSASRTSIDRAIIGGTATRRASTNWSLFDRASTSRKLTSGSIGGHEVGRTSTGEVSSCEAWAGRIEMAVVWVGVIGLPANSDLLTKCRVTCAGLGVCGGGAATLWGQSCSWQGYDRTWSGWSSS